MRDIDDTMAKRRQVLDWEAQYACAIDRNRLVLFVKVELRRTIVKPVRCGQVFMLYAGMNKALQEEYMIFYRSFFPYGEVIMDLIVNGGQSLFQSEQLHLVLMN